MATLTLEYNAKNSAARGIIDIILSMDNLFKVKTDIAEKNPAVTTDKKKVAAAFLDKWAGKFSLTEKEIDDARYNYLLEKYK